MQVDDKLAKEKLISAIQLCKQRLFGGPDFDVCVDLIRNTDLTDCQRRDQKLRDMGIKPRPILRSQFPDDEAKSDE